MSNHRLLYRKEGKASYISHLDLMRTFQRAFLRAELIVRHTEGFNPHAYISVALPLSVGAESVCELLDFELVSDVPISEIPEKLNAVMPAGITVLEAYDATRKVKEISWLDIEGTFEYDNGADQSTLISLMEFFSQDSIVIMKKSKKGMREFDIAPCIENVTFSALGSNIHMRGILAAQNPSLNPDLMVEALKQKGVDFVPDAAFFRRLDVLDTNFNQFR